MERIGGYKVVDEVARGPGTRVVRARRVDGVGGDFAIKLRFESTYENIERTLSGRSLSRGGGTRSGALGSGAVQEPGDVSEGDFLGRAGVQKRVAEAEGSHWLPVYEAGVHEERVYYVTDFHRHSAGFYVKTRTRLSAGAIGQTLSEAAAGVLELERVCGRGHGNLKLSNLMLKGTSRRGRIRLKLTDPAAGVGRAPSTAEDAYALGEILYQLVMFRAFRSYNWPVPDSEEWGRLGRAGRIWLMLCNELLNPDAGQRVTVEQLRRRLTQLERAHRVPRIVATAGAGVVVLLAAGGWRLHAMEAAADRQMSEAGHVWLSALVNQPDELAGYSAVLNEPVISPDERGLLEKSFDLPKAGFPNYRSLELKREAVGVIGKIRERLIRVHRASVETLRNTVAGFERMGWRQPAGELKAVVGRAEEPLPGLRNEIDEARGWNEFFAKNPGPRDAWELLERKLGRMTRDGDRDLSAMAGALRKSAGQSVVLRERVWGDGIARSTELADDVLTQAAVLRVWPRDFDRERMVKEHPRMSLDNATVAEVKEWTTTAPQYAYVSIAVSSDPKIQSLNRELKAIEEEKKQDPSWLRDPGEGPKFEQLAGEIRGRIAGLGEQRFVALDLEPGGRFFEQCRQLSDGIPQLRQFKRPVSDVRMIVRRLERLKASSKFTSPNVEAYWEKHLAGLGPVEKIPAADRDIAINNAESVAGALAMLDKSLPIDPAYGLSGNWLDAARVERGYRLDELLKEVGNTGTMLNRSTLRREDESFAGWCAMTEKLAREFPLGAGVMDAGRVGALMSDWSRSPGKEFWADHVVRTTSPLYPIVEKDLRRIGKIQEMSTASDRAVLARTASDPKEDEELVFAAWDRWNQIAAEAGAAVTAQDVKSLAGVVGNVRGKCASPRLTDVQRKQRQDSVRVAGARMWSEVVSRSSSADVLATSWDVRESFGIVNGAGLSPTARFNLALARLQRGGDGGPPADAVGELQQAVDAMEPADAFAVRGLRDALKSPQVQWGQVRGVAMSTPYLMAGDAVRRRTEYAKVALNYAHQLWDDGEPLKALETLKAMNDPAARSLEAQVQESVRTAGANRQQGMSYWQGQHYPQALDAFTRAARGGDVGAKINLAGMYRGGQGTRVDMTAAKIWFMRAAEQGSVDAMVQLGEVLEAEPAGLAQAAGWYSKAAGKGSVTGAAKLASVEVKNGALQQAAEHIGMGERLEGSGQSSNADLTNAMTDLARFYEAKGNAQLAKDWYGKAAARKGAVAMEWVKKQETKGRSRIRIEDKVQ